MSIKEKYNRYKVSDWVTLCVGVIICAIQVIRYAMDKLSESNIEIVVAVIWLLLIIAPKTLNDVVRKARGLQ